MYGCQVVDVWLRPQSWGSSPSRVDEVFSIPHLADPSRVSVLGVRSVLLTFICAGGFFKVGCGEDPSVIFLLILNAASRITVTDGERYLLHKDVTDPFGSNVAQQGSRFYKLQFFC